MIKIAIAGYGNIGRGIELAITQNEDMELKAVLTRRDPSSVKILTPNVPVYSFSDADKLKTEIDVLILCGGSAKDLPEWGPYFAKRFNTVDSFDTHAKIPEYFKNMDEAAKEGGKTAFISAGWDPGMFSVNRVYAHSILPQGTNYTFWGPGVSAGHSDAIRRIEGVTGAVQYTVPYENAVEAVRSGEQPDFKTREKHQRICYVAAAENYDKNKIEAEIKNMPDYFADYDTEVNFISMDELFKNHSGMPHGGFVIRGGTTASGLKQIIEYSLKLESNPEFTASVLVSSARAVVRLSAKGENGAFSMLDVPPAMFSPKTPEELRREML